MSQPTVDLTLLDVASKILQGWASNSRLTPTKDLDVLVKDAVEIAKALIEECKKP